MSFLDAPNGLTAVESTTQPMPALNAAPVVPPASLDDVVSSLTEALVCLEGTAKSVSFLGDMLAAQQQQHQHPPSGVVPSSSDVAKNNEGASSHLATTACRSVDQDSTQTCNNATTTSSWFIDALLSNSVKEQGVQSAMVCIREALQRLSQYAVLSERDTSSSVAAHLLQGLDGAGPMVRMTDDGATGRSETTSARPQRSPIAQFGSVTPTTTAVPSRTASMTRILGSHAGSFLGASSVARQKPLKKDFENVDDTDVAQWLNENFAHAPKRETNGFELQLDGGTEVSMVFSEHRSSVSSEGSVDGIEAGDGAGGGADGEAMGATLNGGSIAPATDRPTNAGKDEETIDNGTAHRAELKGRTSTAATTVATADTNDPAVLKITTKYTRSTKRSFPAACPHKRTLEMLELVGCPYISDINSPEFDVFAAHDAYGTNLLMYVAMNVFAQYNFVRSLQMDVRTLYVFFETVRFYYRDENPYHNAIHASDVLQTTHVYLCVNDVKENFSDVELFALLFAAIVHDVGHLGIANAFLIKVRHPLARLYNDVSPLENSHAALAFAILGRPECNFFASSDAFTRRLYEDVHNLVIEALHGTDMRLHAEQTRSVEGILEDGVIEDHEVGKLLKAILHAADLSNPMKPLPIYFKWVDRVMAEFWQQGDEEKRRGMPISILCDRNGTNVAKSQMGFISFVVKPFVKELAPVLPSVWLERLDANWSELGQLSQEVEAERVAQITSFAARPWVDVDETLVPSALQVLRDDVCACDSDARILQPSEFHTHNVFRRLEGYISPQDDELCSVPSISAELLQVDTTPPTARSWSTVTNLSSTSSGEHSPIIVSAGEDAEAKPQEPSPDPGVSATVEVGVGGRRSMDGGPRASIVAFAEAPLGAAAPVASTSHSSFQKKRGGGRSGVRQHSIPSSGNPHTRVAAHAGASDVDADSAAYHLHAVTVLTQTLGEALQQQVSLADPAAASTVARKIDGAHGTQPGGDGVWSRWVRTLVELEHCRLHVRERLIARCQRGERRPTVLLLGTALRDDACDAAELSLFSRCPAAAALLLKHMTTTANDGGSEMSASTCSEQTGAALPARPSAAATTLAQAFLNQSMYDRLLTALSSPAAPATSNHTTTNSHSPLACEVVMAMLHSAAGAATSPASALTSTSGTWCNPSTAPNGAVGAGRSKKRLLSFQAETSLTIDNQKQPRSTQQEAVIVVPNVAPALLSLEASMSGATIAVTSSQLGALVLSMTRALFANKDAPTQVALAVAEHGGAKHNGGDARGPPSTAAAPVELPPIKHRSSAADAARHQRAGAATGTATAVTMGSYLPTAVIGRGHLHHLQQHAAATTGPMGTSASSSRSPSALDYSSLSDPSGAASTLWTPAGRMSELYALRAKPLRRTLEVMSHPAWMRDVHNFSPQRRRDEGGNNTTEGTATVPSAAAAADVEEVLSAPQHVATLVVDAVDVMPL